MSKEQLINENEAQAALSQWETGRILSLKRLEEFYGPYLQKNMDELQTENLIHIIHHLNTLSDKAAVSKLLEKYHVLHYMAKNFDSTKDNHQKVFWLLLQITNPYIKDKQGQTPFEVALIHNIDAIGILKSDFAAILLPLPQDEGQRKALAHRDLADFNIEMHDKNCYLVLNASGLARYFSNLKQEQQQEALEKFFLRLRQCKEFYATFPGDSPIPQIFKDGIGKLLDLNEFLIASEQAQKNAIAIYILFLQLEKNTPISDTDHNSQTLAQFMLFNALITKLEKNCEIVKRMDVQIGQMDSEERISDDMPAYYSTKTKVLGRLYNTCKNFIGFAPFLLLAPTVMVSIFLVAASVITPWSILIAFSVYMLAAFVGVPLYFYLSDLRTKFSLGKTQLEHPVQSQIAALKPNINHDYGVLNSVPSIQSSLATKSLDSSAAAAFDNKSSLASESEPLVPAANAATTSATTLLTPEPIQTVEDGKFCLESAVAFYRDKIDSLKKRPPVLTFEYVDSISDLSVVAAGR